MTETNKQEVDLMVWVVLGFVLLSIYFGLWAIAVARADEDTEAIREYQRQRAEFERWFE